MIGARIERLARLQNDDCAVQTGSELLEIVQMRVIDERACTREREARDERIPRCDERRDTLADSTPPDDAVRVALELDAVPVNASRFGKTVDYSYVGWLAPCEKKRGAWQLHGIRRRRRSVALCDERHRSGRPPVPPPFLCDQPQRPRDTHWLRTPACPRLDDDTHH